METIKKKLDNLTIILISFLPFALAAGPAVVEIVSLIIIINFFLLKKKFYFESKEIYIFLFYLITIISSIFSEHKLHSFQSSFFLIRIILLYYIFKNYFRFDSEKIINLTYIILSITLSILIFDVLFQYLFKFSLFGTSSQAENRLNMHFRDEAIIGGYFSKILPVYIFICFSKLKDISQKLNLINILIIILSVICTLLSNERSAAFFLIGFLFMIVFFSNIKNLKKFISLLLLGITVFSFLFTVPSLKSRFINETIEEFTGQNDSHIDITKRESVNKNSNENTISFIERKRDSKFFMFSTAHEAHIMTAINIFKHKYWLGAGPNNFRNFCSEDKYGIYAERGCSTHPHHILSQVLSELGIGGLFFYILIFFYIMRKLLIQFIYRELNYNYIFIFCFYLLLISPIMPAGNLFNNWYLYSISLPFLYLKFCK